MEAEPRFLEISIEIAMTCILLSVVLRGREVI